MRKATVEKQTTTQVLLSILEDESLRRAQNRPAASIKKAGFIHFKYLEDLQRESLPKDCQQVLPELETLQFIKDVRKVILGGLQE